jgi:hypothetical protein
MQQLLTVFIVVVAVIPVLYLVNRLPFARRAKGIISIRDIVGIIVFAAAVLILLRTLGIYPAEVPYH